MRICVPLAQAHIDGDEIHLPYDHETLEGAPRFDVTTVLTPVEEAELRTYYGLTRNDEPPSGDGQ